MWHFIDVKNSWNLSRIFRQDFADMFGALNLANLASFYILPGKTGSLLELEAENMRKWAVLLALLSSVAWVGFLGEKGLCYHK